MPSNTTTYVKNTSTHMLRLMVARLCHFLDHILLHNLLLLMIIQVTSDQNVSDEHDFYFKLLNLSPQSRNTLTLRFAHYVGCITELSSP